MKYFLKVEIPGFGERWAMETQVTGLNVTQFVVSQHALFADAFTKEEAKRATVMLQAIFPRCSVTRIACRPEPILEALVNKHWSN